MPPKGSRRPRRAAITNGGANRSEAPADPHSPPAEPSPPQDRQPTQLAGLHWPVTCGAATQFVRTDVPPHQAADIPRGEPWKEYRDLLVLSVPRRVLQPDATTWGALDRNVLGWQKYACMLSFFLYAVHLSATKLARGHVRVFAELVVKNPFDLQRIDADTEVSINMEDFRDRVCQSTNFMGYRLWVMLGAGAPHPEVMMRTAVFHTQAFMHMIPWPLAHAKCHVLTLPEDMRFAAIQSLAEEEVNKLAAAAKRTAPPAESESQTDPPASDDEALLPPAPGRKRSHAAAASSDQDRVPTVEEVAARIEQDVRRPFNVLEEAEMPRIVLQHLCNGWRSVNTLPAYIVEVLTATHLLAGTLTQELAEQANPVTCYGLGVQLRSDWGEAEWLPDQVRARGGLDALAATSCFSFEQSVMTFEGLVAAESACDAQRDRNAYMWPAGPFQFPYPYLAWELCVDTLHPLLFFQSRFCWQATLFSQEASRLYHEASRCRSTLTGPSARLAISQAPSTLASASVPEDTVQFRPHRAAILGVDADDNNAQDMISAAIEDSSDQMLERITQSNQAFGKPQLAQDQTEYIMSAVIPIYRAFGKDWARVRQNVAALGQEYHSAVGDVESWREQELCRLHALFRVELTDMLLGAISRGANIPSVYSEMYGRLLRRHRISDEYRAQYSMLPQMSIAANAWVTNSEEINEALNLQYGVDTLMETIHALGLQLADPEPQQMLHRLHVGPPAIGKSFNQEASKQALMSSAVSNQDYQSSCALYNKQVAGNRLMLLDDGGETLTNHRKEAQRRNAKEIARAKTYLSAGRSVYERYNKEDGQEATTIRADVFQPRIQDANLNQIELEPNSDMALLDRQDIVLAVASAKSSVSGIQRVNYARDNNLQSLRWARFCEESQQEHALKTLYMVMARARVINSVNTDVLSLMINEAARDANNFLPGFGTALRAAGRATSAATMFVFRTVYYTLFRSESSPLLFYSADRDRLETMPTYVQDSPLVVGPHCYAQWEHGLWMICRQLKSVYSLHHYNILRIVAAECAHFRREPLKFAYRQGGALLIDDEVDKRLQERSLDGRAMPIFVQELCDLERTLDNTQLNKKKHMTFQNVNARNFEADRRRASPAAEEADRGARVSLYGCDPNWLYLGPSMDAVVNASMGAVQQHYHLQAPQVRTVLDQAASMIHMRVPVFQQQNVSADKVDLNSLKFERSSRDAGNSELRYEQKPILRVVRHGTGGGVYINTAALMIPPHLLLPLLLTAAENKHTRPRQTVLSLPLDGYPHLFHTWQICARPERTLVMHSRTATSQQSTVMLRRAGAGTVAYNGGGACESRVVDEDVEVTAFRRHMRELHQMPPYQQLISAWMSGTMEQRKFVADNNLSPPHHIDRPNNEQYECAFAQWVCEHPAYPGRAEERRAELYKNSDTLNQRLCTAEINYPHSHTIDIELQRFLEDMQRNAVSINTQLERGNPVYAANKQFMTAIRLRLFTDWYPHIESLLLSPEWRHVMVPLVYSAWGADNSRRLMKDVPRELDQWTTEFVKPRIDGGKCPPATLPPRCVWELSASQQALLAAHREELAEFSVQYLNALGSWWHAKRTAKRMRLAAIFQNDLHTLAPLDLYKRLVDDQFAQREPALMDEVMEALRSRRTDPEQLTAAEKRLLVVYDQVSGVKRRVCADYASYLRTQLLAMTGVERRCALPYSSPLAQKQLQQRAYAQAVSVK